VNFELRFVDGIEPRYYWRAVTEQGRILAWSENFRTKQDCIEALDAVRLHAARAPVVDRTDRDGAPTGTPD
jgi:uncharacterized protein YegP (UPF0339 family)